VLVQALSSGHKVGLGVVAAVFIIFAFASAFLFPRVRGTFPGRGLPAFIVVCFVFFFGMLTAVEVFGAEPKEKGAEPAGETTLTEAPPTTTQQTTTTAAPQSTASTTTTAPKPKPAPKPAQAEQVAVTETEFKIAMPSTLKAGPVEFDVKNAGQITHDLVITGNGLSAGTPRFNGGQSKVLRVTLKPGTYDVFCSVPGHKPAGMDVKLTVSG
jgi:uncharacterized cupredoxin-like copper-binding protein